MILKNSQTENKFLQGNLLYFQYLILFIFKIKTFLFLTIVFFILANFSFAFKALGSELDELFINLKNSPNAIIAQKYENKIWQFWLTGSSNKTNNLKMKKAIKFMENGNLENALALLINLSKLEPNWAEPLNKIATIKFIQGDFYGSIRDIQLTLKLEPRHFGAISGLAQINFALKRYQDALKNINYVLKIHPFSGVKNLRLVILNLLKKSQI